MSSFADAMMMASLLGNNNIFESRRSRSEPDFLSQLRRFQRWQDTLDETRKKKEDEKKKKDNKGPELPKISYLEAVFWIFFMSPIVGPLWFSLEQYIERMTH